MSEQIKQEVKDVKKNYTRTPNILFDSYEWLHPQEKWLFINLVYLCGAKGTRHLSLRYISERTGISIAALAGSKDPEKNNPGMIRNLHNAGLIHAQIKKVQGRNGKEKGQPQYHISIVDIWQLNEQHFSKCSESEQSEDEQAQGVQNMNASVQKTNTFTSERSEYEQERSDSSTNIRLQDKTTEDTKITEQEREKSAIAPTHAPAVSLEQESETRTNGIPANGILAIVPLGSTHNGAVPEHPLRVPQLAHAAKGLTSDDGLDTPIGPPQSVRSSVALGDVATVRGEAGGRRDGQLSEQTSPTLSKDGAVRTSPSGPRASGGRKPREKQPVKPTQPAKELEPDFVLTDLQMAFWQLWCEVWFNAGIPQKVNETAYNHVKVLAPLIKTDEDMKSLTDYARKELAEREGVKRKRVYLGNCVTSYPGWKQAQRKDDPTPASNGLPPQMTREQRKAMPVW